LLDISGEEFIETLVISVVAEVSEQHGSLCAMHSGDSYVLEYHGISAWMRFV
jgi:hypothetical protein